MHLPQRLAATLAALVMVFQTAASHSWVEQLLAVAPNGTFTGNPGFIRNYTPRTVPNFDDGMDLNLVPPDGRANQSYIAPTDPMCNPNMTRQVQSAGNPRLQAAPGSPIALQYQENGHVTLPHNQPGKPTNRGTVYIYGTTQPLTGEYLLTVHRNWTTDGTGGDKRGRLLSTQNFDDGQCYQVNTGNISEARQKEFPFTPTNPMGDNLWCQNDLVLPTDAPTGQPYTLYWVWDWPTLPGSDSSVPEGKEEIYTSCMDIDIIALPSTHKDIAKAYDREQQVNNAAVSSYIASIATGNNILVTTPLNDALQTAALTTTSAISTPSTAESSPTASTPTLPLVTIYPVTTLMTTVLLTPSSGTASPPSAATSVLSAVAATTTITVTPTIVVTVPAASPTLNQAAPAMVNSPASSAYTTLAIAGAANSSTAAAPATNPTDSAISGVAYSSTLAAPSTYPTASTPAPVPSGSNCTSSTVQKRSRILGAYNVQERAIEKAPIVFKPRARMSRSAKFGRF